MCTTIFQIVYYESVYLVLASVSKVVSTLF